MRGPGQDFLKVGIGGLGTVGLPVARWLDGSAEGLVLAAETAIGGYPVESVGMIRNLIDESETWTPDTSLVEIMGG